jgi:hypothetical protein
MILFTFFALDIVSILATTVADAPSLKFPPADQNLPPNFRRKFVDEAVWRW